MTAQEYFDQGIQAYQNQNFEQAIVCFTKSIELNPNKAAPYNNRGRVYSVQKHNDLAITDFTKAIEIDSSDPILFHNRGSEYANQFQFELAIKDLTKAIRFKIKYAGTYYNRGVAYYYLNNLELAIKDFTQAIKIAPDYIDAYMSRGRLYGNRAQYALAIHDYTKVIELAPMKAEAYNERGLAYRKTGLLSNAIEDYNQAITLLPNFHEAYNNLAYVYALKNVYNLSITNYNRAINLSPKYAAPLLGRGSINKLFGNIGLAQADWVRFVTLDKGEGIAQHFRDLAVFFRDVAAAPYVVRQMVEKVPVAEALLSFRGLLSQTEAQCRVMDAYLAQVGTLRDAATKQPAAYHTLLAYVHFEMGTVGTAFQIFDEILDNQLNHELSLREEYYYLRSAEAFQEPTESIRANALEKAQDFYESFEANTASPTAQVEMYYAGLLFFYTGQVEQAHRCFTKVFLQFPPAAYMQVLTLEKLGRREDLDKKIERIRRWELNQPQPQFLHGFAPCALLLDEPDFLTSIHAYLLHTEIVEAVQLVRQEGDAPYQSPPLWEAFTISEIALLRLRTQLFAHALIALDKEYHHQLCENPVAELSRWRQNQAEKDFAELKTLATNSEALELRIAEFIKTWDTDPVYFEYYLKYFYCREELGVLATHSLYHYLKVFKQAKANTSEINATLWEKLTEESSKELFTVSTSALVSVTTGIATAGAFLSIPMAVVAGVFTKVVLQKADIFIQHLKDKNQLPDYTSFKYQLVNELRAEIESQSADNAAAYEQYVIPELKKWVPKETNW
jgi:tetratricopeptide (TPR) repeat protein